jgi:hypothetical protein
MALVPQFPATDHSWVRTLPREIIFPSDAVLEQNFKKFDRVTYIDHIFNLARGLAVDKWRLEGQKPAPPYVRGFPPAKIDLSGKDTVIIRESDDLKPIDWSSFPILVDGTPVIIDFNDGHNFNGLSFQYSHWLRFRFHSNCKPYPQLGALTMTSFSDWARYDQLQQQVREQRDPYTVRTIMCNQHLSFANDRNYRRRLMVRGLMHKFFGDRTEFNILPLDVFHQAAAQALCFVSVPGDWENQMARGQLQMIGLGMPTISPILYEQCCDGLLQPGIHYLACRQDFLDVPDLVRWLDAHPDEARAMSHNAWLFFQEFCTPIAVWSYIKDRIEHGARHWRASINDDISPPGLYAPPSGQAGI